MKKLIFILGVLVLIQITQAKDIKEIVYRDSVTAADTNGNGTQTFDTTFGNWAKVDGATRIMAFVRLVPNRDVIDTNFADDTFFVNVQFSFDKIIIVKTVRLDTLLDDGNVQTGAVDLIADSIVADFMRPMLIHNTQKRKVANFTKVYGKKLKFYYTLQK